MTVNWSIRPMSGRQRERRSGRGFPKSSFMPCVIMKDVASDKARPIQAVFHSQSFLRHIKLFGVPLFAVGPGTNIRQTKKVMSAGMMRAMSINSHVGIVSCCSKG